MAVTLHPFSIERMERAVIKVHERLLRATAALGAGGVPYAVVGGNAVAAWVSRVDEAAVRNTQDVTFCCGAQTCPRRPRPWKRQGLSTATPRATTCFWTARLRRRGTPS